MDSGNSGSLQSSSGGDDEFDSRCGADTSPLSALLRQPPPSVPGFGGGSLIYGLQELRTPPLSHWCSTTAAPLPAGPEAPASPPSLPGHGSAMAADQADAAPAHAQAAAAPALRGSRKRARTSRREPTTVLTTDTSNFRAMVQEFTGIPAPPFAGAATATARSRFDHHLFPLRTAVGTANPATLPQYLLRPFAQKVQVHASSATPYPPSFTSPSTTTPANISIAPASTSTPDTTAVASSDSYHQLTAASTSALLGMQQDNGSNNNYHSSFHQSSSLGVGDGKYAAHPAFDSGIAPPPPPSSATRLQDPADFLGLTHDVMVGSQGPHAHLHPRNGREELSGLVLGGASVVTGTGGCKATYSSTRPLLERNNRRRNPSAGGGSTATTAPVAATAAGMRTQAGVVDSWVGTSD